MPKIMALTIITATMNLSKFFCENKIRSGHKFTIKSRKGFCILACKTGLQHTRMFEVPNLTATLISRLAENGAGLGEICRKAVQARLQAGMVTEREVFSLSREKL